MSLKGYNFLVCIVMNAIKIIIYYTLLYIILAHTNVDEIMQNHTAIYRLT